MIKRLSPEREEDIRAIEWQMDDMWEQRVVSDLLSEIDALREENKILYEALSASRGQWVHSVSNNICLAAISKYERGEG